MTHDHPPTVVSLRKPVLGRLRKTYAGTDKLLKCGVLKDPSVTAGELRKAYPKLRQVVAESTVHHLWNQLACDELGT